MTYIWFWSNNDNSVDSVENGFIRSIKGQKIERKKPSVNLTLCIFVCRKCEKQCGFPHLEMWIYFFHIESTIYQDYFSHTKTCAQLCAQTLFVLKNQ